MPFSALVDQLCQSAHIIGRRRLIQCSIRFIATSLLLTSVIYSPLHAADAVDRSQAIEIAKQQNGGNGKVLGVTTTTDPSGNTVYAVKLLSNGRVRIYKINKASD